MKTADQLLDELLALEARFANPPQAQSLACRLICAAAALNALAFLVAWMI